MTDKTFSIAGVSRLKGEMTVRFANDMTRVKVLQKNDHTDIDLIELREPMTKEAAVAYLLSIDFATKDGVFNQEVHAALLAEDDKRNAKTEPKEPKAKKVKPTLDGIAAKKTAPKKTAPKSTVTKEQATATKEDAALEDAPF
jgi:hypothetical protein